MRKLLRRHLLLSVPSFLTLGALIVLSFVFSSILFADQVQLGMCSRDTMDAALDASDALFPTLRMFGALASPNNTMSSTLTVAANLAGATEVSQFEWDDSDGWSLQFNVDPESGLSKAQVTQQYNSTHIETYTILSEAGPCCAVFTPGVYARAEWVNTLMDASNNNSDTPVWMYSSSENLVSGAVLTRSGDALRMHLSNTDLLNALSQSAAEGSSTATFTAIVTNPNLFSSQSNILAAYPVQVPPGTALINAPNPYVAIANVVEQGAFAGGVEGYTNGFHYRIDAPEDEAWIMLTLVQDSKLASPQERSVSAGADIAYVVAGLLIIIQAVLGVYFVLAERRRAHQRAAEQRDFVAFLCHELRNPLNGIMIAAECVIDEGQEDNGRMILDSAKILRCVVNDILDLSKLQAGSMQVEDIPVSVADTIKCVYALFGGIFSRKGVAFPSPTIDQCVPANIVGDPLRIQQVLTNFVSNASKFTEKGSVTISVQQTIGDGKHGLSSGVPYIRFCVADTGIGIADEDKIHLFEAYSQAKVHISRKFGGTGLGLAICAHLAKLMHGRVWFESRVGVGSSFYLAIPLKNVPEDVREEEDRLEDERSKALEIIVEEPQQHDGTTIAATRLSGAGVASTPPGQQHPQIVIPDCPHAVSLSSIDARDSLPSTPINVAAARMAAALQASMSHPQQSSFSSSSSTSGHNREIRWPSIMVGGTTTAATRLRGAGVASTPPQAGQHQPHIVISNSLHSQFPSIDPRDSLPSTPINVAAARMAAALHASISRPQQSSFSSSSSSSSSGHNREIRWPSIRVGSSISASPQHHSAVSTPVSTSAQNCAVAAGAFESVRSCVRGDSPVTQNNNNNNMGSHAQNAMPTDSVIVAIPSEKVILLVEDNLINQRVTRRVLEAAGYKVDSALNGQIAVDLWTQQPRGHYACILMDMEMPIMDGFTATRKIRDLEESSRGDPRERQKIIALSGNVTMEDRQRAKQAHLDGFISKPFQKHELLSALADLTLPLSE